jgi:hypothetical protein
MIFTNWSCLWFVLEYSAILVIAALYVASTYNRRLLSFLRITICVKFRVMHLMYW